jgi:ABC-type nitrate/sulfonate/bicarbonate transport system permease component
MRMQINYTKLVTIIVVATGAIFLSYTGNLASEAVASLLAACLGYVFGNSHGLAEASKMAQSQQVVNNGK